MKIKNLLLIPALVSPVCCLADGAPASHPTGPEIWIAFLPVIFFLLILLVTLFKLKSVDGTPSGLFTEKDAPPPADDNPNAQQSTSRVIAFLTGLVALTIGVCLTTFWTYSYFENPASPVDLSKLSTVILGLGIGVLPYGFNKAADALKPNAPAK